MTQISIHAPAKGATMTAPICLMDSGISIHAPAKGATEWLDKLISAYGISIHAPAKGATWWEGAAWLGKAKISIHAPAKGATIAAMTVTILCFNFNPRSREGSDGRGWL